MNAKTDLRDKIQRDAHVRLNKALGHKIGINAALLLAALIGKDAYFEGRGELMNGWFYNTSDNIQRDTCLTESQRRTASKKLKGLGLVQIRLRGVPATTYYKINYEVCLAFISASGSPEIERLPIAEAENTHVANSNKSISSQEA